MANINNAEFYRLLHERRIREGVTSTGRPLWTTARVAAAVGSGRAHLTQVLGNKPQRGGQTRRKLVAFFRKEFPETWRQILAALKWDQNGNPTGF